MVCPFSLFSFSNSLPVYPFTKILIYIVTQSEYKSNKSLPVVSEKWEGNEGEYLFNPKLAVIF